MARASAAPTSGPALDNRRVLAALIDVAIIAVGYFVILGVTGRSDTAGNTDALYVVCIGWALYYYFAMESGNGQTLGKRAMKIRVVGMDGQPAGMRAIGLRTVLRVIDGLAAYLVGLIVMLVTGERRGRLGDLVGKTMIVSADKPAPAPDLSAPEMPAAAAPRVPIAESGPAFAEAGAVTESEPAAEPEPAAEAERESVEEADVVAGSGPEVASPALVELASDVSAVTDDPEREVEPEPEPEIEELPPAATLEAEAAAKAASGDGDAEAEAASEPEPEPRIEDLPSAETEELPSAETEELPSAETEELPSGETEELPSAETEETDVDEDEAEEVEPDDGDLEVEAEDEVEELDAEADEEVTVKSVETVSAIDLVMEDEQAVAGSQGKGRRR